MTKNTLFTVPNILTYLRLAGVLLIPLCFVFFQEKTASLIAFCLFVISAATDFLDGYFARKLNQITAFGKMLDPIADKVMILVCFMVIAGRDGLSLWFAIPAALITMREVLVSGLREFLGAELKLPVTQLAKWKTTLQLVAVGGLLLAGAGFATLPLYILSYILLWVAMAATLITGFDYFHKGLPHIQQLEETS